MTEYWDIYDSDKKRTGRLMKRNDWILKDGEYHLSVLALIANEDGRYLITKRAMDKHWAPGWWEVPGGGVRAGETSSDAIRREVFEETGIDLAMAEGTCVHSYHVENPGEGDNYFVDIYRFVTCFSEEDVKLQTEEATAFRLALPEEIGEIASHGVFLHYERIRDLL